MKTFYSINLFGWWVQVKREGLSESEKGRVIKKKRIWNFEAFASLWQIGRLRSLSLDPSRAEWSEKGERRWSGVPLYSDGDGQCPCIAAGRDQSPARVWRWRAWWPRVLQAMERMVLQHSAGDGKRKEAGRREEREDLEIERRENGKQIYGEVVQALQRERERERERVLLLSL